MLEELAQHVRRAKVDGFRLPLATRKAEQEKGDLARLRTQAEKDCQDISRLPRDIQQERKELGEEKAFIANLWSEYAALIESAKMMETEPRSIINELEQARERHMQTDKALGMGEILLARSTGQYTAAKTLLEIASATLQAAKPKRVDQEAAVQTAPSAQGDLARTIGPGFAQLFTATQGESSRADESAEKHRAAVEGLGQQLAEALMLREQACQPTSPGRVISGNITHKLFRPNAPAVVNQQSARVPPPWGRARNPHRYQACWRKLRARDLLARRHRADEVAYGLGPLEAFSTGHD